MKKRIEEVGDSYRILQMGKEALKQRTASESRKSQNEKEKQRFASCELEVGRSTNRTVSRTENLHTRSASHFQTHVFE